jgi:eukaryotic-like serine/threonine-protein kinase
VTIGDRLGPYEVLALLGAGGMGGGVSRAEHEARPDVAIKVLSHAVEPDPERTARFKREAQVLASLNNPKHRCLSRP